MTETLYEKFRASINRDGADYGIVSRARGEARDRLEDDLINHLDYFDIPALTMMKSTKAVPHLKRELPRSSGALHVRIAKALWDICNDAGAPAKIAAVLLSSPDVASWGDRMEAAIGLRGIEDAAVDKALRKALFEKDCGFMLRTALLPTAAAS